MIAAANGKIKMKMCGWKWLRVRLSSSFLPRDKQRSSSGLHSPPAATTSQHMADGQRGSACLWVSGREKKQRDRMVKRVLKEPELERLADNEMERGGLYFVPAVALQIITADMMSVSLTLRPLRFHFLFLNKVCRLPVIIKSDVSD